MNIFDMSATMDVIAVDNKNPWMSCSVETPGFCTQSTVSHSGATSKLLAGLLLGVVMVVML